MDVQILKIAFQSGMYLLIIFDMAFSLSMLEPDRSHGSAIHFVLPRAQTGEGTAELKSTDGQELIAVRPMTAIEEIAMP